VRFYVDQLDVEFTPEGEIKPSSAS
jgi:hypothetical protein